MIVRRLTPEEILDRDMDVQADAIWKFYQREYRRDERRATQKLLAWWFLVLGIAAGAFTWILIGVR